MGGCQDRLRRAYKYDLSNGAQAPCCLSLQALLSLWTFWEPLHEAPRSGVSDVSVTGCWIGTSMPQHWGGSWLAAWVLVCAGDSGEANGGPPILGPPWPPLITSTFDTGDWHGSTCNPSGKLPELQVQFNRIRLCGGWELEHQPALKLPCQKRNRWTGSGGWVIIDWKECQWANGWCCEDHLSLWHIGKPPLWTHSLLMGSYNLQ